MRTKPFKLSHVVVFLSVSALLTGGLTTLLSAERQGDEQSVTVIKRDGGRVAGRLEALGDDSVWVRVSQADQQKLPLGDVLVIDFVPGAGAAPESELSQARGADHVLALKDGNVVRGRLVGMQGGTGSGQEGRRVALFQEGSGGQPRQYEVDRISRIYLGNYPAATTESAQAAKAGSPADVPAGAIRIPANQEWTATPVAVRAGERITFSVTGTIVLSDAQGDTAGPAGSLQMRKAPNAPLQENYAGCLIARIGNSKPFAIGNIATPISMPASGQLYLGINDDHVADNKGEFYVQLSRGRQGR